jgi:hypothetical protein
VARPASDDAVMALAWFTCRRSDADDAAAMAMATSLTLVEAMPTALALVMALMCWACCTLAATELAVMALAWLRLRRSVLLATGAGCETGLRKRPLY